MNSVQSAFCSECGGRLLASHTPPPEAPAPPAIKGLSLPTKSLSADGGPPAAEAEEADDGVPAWLRELRASQAEDGGASGASADMESVPDWLRDLRASLPDEPTPEPEPAAPAEEVPDWLAELRPTGAEQPPAAAPEPEPAAPAEEVPDWLAEQKPKAEAETVEPGEPLAAAEVPDWLAELRPAGAEEPAAPAVGEPPEEGALPDWLVPAEPEEGEALVRAEIPDWLLALKPRELRAEGEEIEPEPIAEEAAEETGLLAGIPGVLPVEMIIAQPQAATEPPPMTVAGDFHQARLFAQVVSQAAEAHPIPLAGERPKPMSPFVRWAIYFLLLFVVTVPLLVGRPLLPRAIEPSEPTQALYARIEQLPPDAPVVVAFDYDPSGSDEMNLVAQVLLGHLMDRQARLIIVSLLPTGPATAQQLMAELTADRPDYADGYGQRYVNLGYIPGQAAAARLFGETVGRSFPRDFFGTPLTDLPLMDGLIGAQDLDLIVSLTANQEHLRWWIEQVGTPLQVDMVGGVSAQIEPAALAYHATDPPQLLGLVSGVPGAAQYEALLGRAPTGSVAAQLDVQLAGHGLLVLVGLIGGIVALVQRGRERGD